MGRQLVNYSPIAIQPSLWSSQNRARVVEGAPSSKYINTETQINSIFTSMFYLFFKKPVITFFLKKDFGAPPPPPTKLPYRQALFHIMCYY